MYIFDITLQPGHYSYNALTTGHLYNALTTDNTLYYVISDQLFLKPYH